MNDNYRNGYQSVQTTYQTPAAQERFYQQQTLMQQLAAGKNKANPQKEGIRNAR